jgi:hypothetical protein
MKKLYTLTMVLLLMSTTLFTYAQKRYIAEQYTDAEIEVVSDVKFATNIDFLTSSFTDQAQTVADLTAIKTALFLGQPIPATHYNPADAGSKVKVTDLKMDIYKPKTSVDATTDRPVVVFIHTGNFLPPPINGSPTGVKTDSSAIVLCQSWAKRGYVAVSIDYRLGWNPLATSVYERRGQLLNAVYRAIHDTKQAVRYIKDNATMYGIDAEEVVLYGEGSGAYVALAYETLDKYPDMELPKFSNPLTSKSFIDTATVGLIDGSGGALNLYAKSSTSTEIRAVITAGGALADTSWLEAGDAPMIAFQCIRDPFAPFNEGVVVVPTTNEDVVEVQGANLYIKKANELGNNDAIKDMKDETPYTAIARSRYGKTYDYIYTAPLDKMTVNEEVEGLFPIIRPLGASLLQNQAGPWQWWDPTSPLATAIVVQPNVTAHMASLQSNPTMSPTQGRAYVDTIMGYMCPRVAVILGYYEADALSAPSVNKIPGTLMPNPAVNNATLAFANDVRINSVVITNLTGSVVYQNTIFNSNTAEIDLTSFSTGYYFIQAETSKGNWAGKLIKE